MLVKTLQAIRLYLKNIVKPKKAPLANQLLKQTIGQLDS